MKFTVEKKCIMKENRNNHAFTNTCAHTLYSIVTSESIYRRCGFAISEKRGQS